jgi:hypothetical protein
MNMTSAQKEFLRLSWDTAVGFTFLCLALAALFNDAAAIIFVSLCAFSGVLWWLATFVKKARA